MNRVDRFWFIRLDTIVRYCPVYSYFETLDSDGRVVWADSYEKARMYATKKEALRAMDLVRSMSRGDAHLVSLAKVTVKR